MGTPGGGETGNWPPDGGLPGLPPEWGRIVIPDDPSELDWEASQVRRELRRAAGRRERRGLPRLPRLLGDDPSARLAGLVVLVAIVAMLAGLFSLGNSVSRNALTTIDRTPDASASPPRRLPALDLLDGDGHAVSLRSLLPAIILLTEGCACADLIAASESAAPPGVSVLVVTAALPRVPVPAGTGAVRALADPAADLRTLLGLPASGSRAGALLVTGDAEISRSLPVTTSAEDFRTDLDRLVVR